MRKGADSELSISNSRSGRWLVHRRNLVIHGPLPDAGTARWVLDLYRLDLPATDPRWDEVGGKRLLGHRDCVHKVDADSPCAGAVEYRAPLDPMGRRLSLCEKHWREPVADQRHGDDRADSCMAQCVSGVACPDKPSVRSLDGACASGPALSSHRKAGQAAHGAHGSWASRSIAEDLSSDPAF